MRKTVHSRASAVLCEAIAKARKEAGLTQQQLADHLRRHQSFVAKIENGERRLDVVEFLEIARILGTDPIKMLHDVRRELGQ